MPFDPAYPVDHSKIRAAEFRAQFGALKALNDDLAGNLGALGSQLTTQAEQLSQLSSVMGEVLTRVAALEAVPPVPLEIALLTYLPGTQEMQLDYPVTGGEGADTLNLLYWIGDTLGSPNVLPVTRPTQTVSLSGVVNFLTTWQVEAINPNGTRRSLTKEYFVN